MPRSLRPLAHLWGRIGLRGRILLAFVLLMTVTALAYAWAVICVVEFTEEELMTRGMTDESVRVEQVLARGRTPKLQDGWALYLDPVPGPAGDRWRETTVPPMPEAFREAHDGFSELLDPPAFLYKRTVVAGVIAVTLDQARFEAQEIWIMRFTWASVFVVLAISLVVGGLLAAAVLSPIERLSWAVRRQVGAKKYVPLAADVSNDEVGQLARLCDRAMRELYEALDREKAFTGDVSHELRTPLTVIETSGELLSMANLSERERRHVERIRTNARAMGEMIDLFLELARTEGPALSTNRGAEATEVVDAVQEVWEPRARAKNLRLELFETAALPHRKGENLLEGKRFPARHLMTVLGNLVKNAVRYTENGMVLVAVTDTGLAVADTGPGLGKDEAARIFDPMMRGAAARTQEEKKGASPVAPGNIRTEGLGLGLAIAMKVAERCGWGLTVADPEKWAEANPEAAAVLREASDGHIGAVFEIELVKVAKVERLDRKTEII